MVQYIERKYLSEKRLIPNICNALGNITLAIILYFIAISTKINVVIVAFVCGIFLLKAALSFACMLKFRD